MSERYTRDPHNANVGTARGRAIIAASIAARGAGRSGLAAADGTMIAGSQTLAEMQAAGVPIRAVHTTGDEWVVVIRDDIAPGSEDATLLALDDNRASEVGLSWSPEALLAIQAQGVALEALWSDDELAALIGEAAQEPADDPPVAVDESKPTRCQPGDVWRVGAHTLACLDSTDAANVARVLAGRTVAMVWADPPYGIDIGSKSGGTRTRLAVAGDDYHVIGDNESYDPSPLLDLRLPTVLWGANHYADKLPPSPSWLIWDKREGGTPDDSADCELAWTNLGGPARLFAHKWRGMIKASEQGQSRVHPTQKPIALAEWAFDKYGAPGDLILDPFLGSGPSVKAAQRTGRTVVGFELAPAYIDHIIEWGESEGLTVQRAEP